SPYEKFSCWIRTDASTGQTLSTWLKEGEVCSDPNGKAALDAFACGPGLQCVPSPSALRCRKLCDTNGAPCAQGSCVSLVGALPNTFAKSPANVGVCCTQSIASGCNP